MLRGLHAEAARAAENLPRIVPDEEQCLRAAVSLLLCVRCAEKDAALSAADRARAVQAYTERIRAFIEQAGRHASKPAPELASEAISSAALAGVTVGTITVAAGAGLRRPRCRGGR